jgi:hypothetical protein
VACSEEVAKWKSGKNESNAGAGARPAGIVGRNASTTATMGPSQQRSQLPPQLRWDASDAASSQSLIRSLSRQARRHSFEQTVEPYARDDRHTQIRLRTSCPVVPLSHRRCDAYPFDPWHWRLPAQPAAFAGPVGRAARARTVVAEYREAVFQSPLCQLVGGRFSDISLYGSNF